MDERVLTDQLWQRLEPLIPVPARRYRFPGRKRADNRAAPALTDSAAVHHHRRHRVVRDGGHHGGAVAWRLSNGPFRLATAASRGHERRVGNARWAQ